MPSTPAQYDFRFFCDVFKRWRHQSGDSQDVVARRGGPSKPIIKAIEDGTWTSVRPKSTLDKVDKGFQWPAGTAWKVLTLQLDPTATEGFVGGSVQAHQQYVSSSVSEQVEGGKQDAEVLRAITSMSAALDQLVTGQRHLAERVDVGQQSLVERVDAVAAGSDARFAALEAGLRELSERVEQLEEPGP
ncbi:hypothetical protein KVF89_22685 [Nocardioides carbamazepini]|uniref:hypothetical protein n=1 Tax=Nocardioides carbamazepini TaxID=2854259 RepID=UPI00214A0D1F|nr:hypothetical protein [Nocardioides carbamazepini]MCR1785365.1 hypothetical protein [Nocardioides carbamazepini]